MPRGKMEYTRKKTKYSTGAVNKLSRNDVLSFAMARIHFDNFLL